MDSQRKAIGDEKDNTYGNWPHHAEGRPEGLESPGGVHRDIRGKRRTME